MGNLCIVWLNYAVGKHNWVPFWTAKYRQKPGERNGVRNGGKQRANSAKLENLVSTGLLEYQ